MLPFYVLQMLHRGRWEEIGWRAQSEDSLRDLERHGERLAATETDPQVRYRLAILSLTRTDPDTEVRLYPAA